MVVEHMEGTRVGVALGVREEVSGENGSISSDVEWDEEGQSDELKHMSEKELQEHEEQLRAVLLETLKAAEESIVVQQ